MPELEDLTNPLSLPIFKNFVFLCSWISSLENFSKEEVYDHRKAKFLKIGRDQGFSQSSDLDNGGLSYKEPGIQKIKLHIVQNKLVYIGIGLVFIAGLISIIYW